MKLIVYKVNTKKKDKSYKRKTSAVRLERLLFVTFFITFLVLVIAQAAMTNPSVRTFLTSSGDYEGAPLGAEEYLYAQGEIGLKLMNGYSNESLKVLVNGDEIAAFSSRGINLQVKNGDVIEIDGSSVADDAKVCIVSKSANITADCLNKTIVVNSNVKELVRVKIDEEF